MTLSLGASLQLNFDSRGAPTPSPPPTLKSAAPTSEPTGLQPPQALAPPAEAIELAEPHAKPHAKPWAKADADSRLLHGDAPSSSNTRFETTGGAPTAPSAEVPPSADTPNGASGAKRARWTLMMAATAVRLVLMPALLMPFHTLCTRAGWLPREPLVLMVLDLQSAVPSGMVLVPLLAASGRTHLAEELSGLFLPQYLLATFTVSAAVIAAITSTEATLGAQDGSYALAFPTAEADPPGPWAAVGRLASCNDSAFHAAVVPLSLMVRLTYTATTGSYYNASERDATVPAWTRDLAHTANPTAGMRALLFVQPKTRRAVVAFRGTE